MNMTVTMEISAPRAISVHRELIISISEYSPTPKVAAKKLKADTRIEAIDVECAIQIDSFRFFPDARSVRFVRTDGSVV